MELFPGSLFGYQCLSWIYYECKEYETGLEYATKGRDLVRKKGRETGRTLEKYVSFLTTVEVWRIFIFYPITDVELYI